MCEAVLAGADEAAFFGDGAADFGEDDEGVLFGDTGVFVAFAEGGVAGEAVWVEAGEDEGFFEGTETGVDVMADIPVCAVDLIGGVRDRVDVADVETPHVVDIAGVVGAALDAAVVGAGDDGVYTPF